MHTASDALIVIFGLSHDSHRYAYKAAQKLLAQGYKNLQGVHPSREEVLGIPVVGKIEEIKQPIHTITLYIGSAKSLLLLESIVAAKPQRIIFNPGAECEALAQKAREQGIETLEACTLVMLSTHQF